MSVAKMFKKSGSEDATTLPDKLPRVKREKYNKDSYVSRKKQRTQQKANVKGAQQTLMAVNPTLKRRKAKRIAQHANSPTSPYQHKASTEITTASAKKSVGMKYVDESKVKKKPPKSSGNEEAANSAAAKWEARTRARDEAMGLKPKKGKLKRR